MNTTTVFTVIVVAAALTYLYMRFGVTTTKFTVPSDRAHGNTGDSTRSTTYEYPTVADDAANTSDATDLRFEREKNHENRSENNRRFDAVPDPASTEGQTSGDRLTVDNAQEPDGRSLPETSKTTSAEPPPPPLLFGLQSESTNNNPQPVYQIEGVDDDYRNIEPTTDDDHMRYRPNKRPNSQRDIKQKDHSSTTNGKLMNPDYETYGYQNGAYGPSNNVQGAADSENYKDYGNPVYGTGWTPSSGKPEPPGSSWSAATDGQTWEIPPPYPGPGYRYPAANHGYDYAPALPAMPPNRPSTYYDHHYPVHHHHKHHAVDWRKVGSLIFIKLGFLKLLFVIWYKLAIVMKLTFFKLQVIRNVTDIVNSLPTAAMEWFTTMMKILTLPGLMLSSTMMTAPAGINPGNILPADPGVDPRPSRLNTILPNLLSKLVTASVSRPNTPGRTTRSGSGIGTEDSSTPSESAVTDNNSTAAASLIDGRPSSGIFEPVSQVFRDVLNSEKCAQRIACQISALEKSGIVPYWFNWVLNGMSNIIPKDELESYRRTYETVNDEMHTKSPNPDNWATWCLDRYECNNTTVTKIIDANKQ